MNYVTIFEDANTGHWLDIKLCLVKHRTMDFLQKCEVASPGLRIDRPLEFELPSATFKGYYDRVVVNDSMVRVLRARVRWESLDGYAAIVGEPDVV